MVDVALESLLQTPASEPKLTNPDEVREAIRGHKVGKAPGPNGNLNRALKYLPMRAVLILVQTSMPSYASITSTGEGSGTAIFLTGAVFPDVAKAFYTVWIEGLL